MISEKQRAANRQNAAKSSGPRTSEGRARSARNALKHGWLAADLTIVDDPDHISEIRAFLDYWANFYQPATPIERALVRQMSILQWRLERAPRLESGLVSKASCDEFDNHTKFNEETQKRTNRFYFNEDKDPAAARPVANQLLGHTWLTLCRNGDPLPKLARYETALANRLMRCIDFFLRLRQSGIDSPGEAPIELDDLPADGSRTAEILDDAPPPPPPAAPPEPEFPNEPISAEPPVSATPSEPPAAQPKGTPGQPVDVGPRPKLSGGASKVAPDGQEVA